MEDRHVYALLQKSIRERSPAVLMTVVEAPSPSLLAKKALFVFDGARLVDQASTMSPDLEAIALERAQESVRAYEPVLNAPAGERGDRRSTKRVALVELREIPGVKVCMETFLPTTRLVIAGGGHIAQPTHRIASVVGFSVTILDDRPAFADPARFPEADQVICEEFAKGIRELSIDERTAVVIVTRGHLHDLEVLRALVGSSPVYVGMIGSRRRVLTVLRRLRSEGVPDEFIDRIYSPIGLDIGAETPQEIALAIVAEVLCVLKGGSGAHLRRGLRRIRLE